MVEVWAAVPVVHSSHHPSCSAAERPAELAEPGPAAAALWLFAASEGWNTEYKC